MVDINYSRILSRKTLYNKVSSKLSNIILYDNKYLFNPSLPTNSKLTQAHILKFMGSGARGQVDLVEIVDIGIFVIKQAFIDSELFPEKTHKDWHEMLIMRDIITPMVLSGQALNFPILYSYFLGNSCRPNVKYSNKLPNIKTNVLCINYVFEPAQGTLGDWFKVHQRTVDETWNALFQILCAVYTLQAKLTACHRDISEKNVVYYRVPSGGSWKYTILGEDYYLPNIGFLFILIDFGVMTIYDPLSHIKHIYGNNTQRLGTRLIIDEKNDKVHLTKSGEKTIIYTSKYMTKPKSTNPNIWSPEVAIPHQFMYDTQNCIKMFIGGSHERYMFDHDPQPVDKSIKDVLIEYIRYKKNDKLSKYLFPLSEDKTRKYKSVASYKIDNTHPLNKYTQLSQYSAGHLIQKVFATKYKIIVGEIIDSFVI